MAQQPLDLLGSNRSGAADHRGRPCPHGQRPASHVLARLIRMVGQSSGNSEPAKPPAQVGVPDNVAGIDRHAEWTAARPRKAELGDLSVLDPAKLPRTKF